MVSSHHYRTVAVALMVALATVGSMPTVAAAQADEPTEIDDCTVITESGEYVLTGDILNTDEDPCIRILTDGVTFDGDDNRITGNDTAGQVGISVQTDSEEVVIKNVQVSNFDIALDIDGVDVRLENVQFTNNLGDAVRASNFDKLTVKESTLSNNGGDGINATDFGNLGVYESQLNNNTNGISAENGDQVHVKQSELNDNRQNGLVVDDIKTVYVEDSSLSGNGSDGLLASNVTKLSVADSTLSDNGGDGIDAQNNVEKLFVENSDVNRNGDDGIDADPESDQDWPAEVSITDNHINNNDRNGIEVQSDKTLIKNNRIIGNGQFNDGILTSANNLESVTGEQVRDFLSKGSFGILLHDADKGKVANNVVSRNGNGGIVAFDPDNVKFKENTIIENGGPGLFIFGNNENLNSEVLDNRILNNRFGGLLVLNANKMKIDGNQIIGNDFFQLAVVDSTNINIGENDLGL